MRKAKIAITIDESILARIDRLVVERVYYNDQGDSMQLDVLDFIFDVNYCVISDV